MMNKQELETFAREAAKGIKTEKDLNAFSQMLTKITVEAALNAELESHLGYSKHDETPSENCRNGYSSKQIKTEDGTFELEPPRDRHGDFEPQLIKKRQTRFTSMDSTSSRSIFRAVLVWTRRRTPAGIAASAASRST